MPNNQKLSLRFSDDTIITPLNLQCFGCFVESGVRCYDGFKSVDRFHAEREAALRQLARSADLEVTEC